MKNTYFQKPYKLLLPKKKIHKNKILYNKEIKNFLMINTKFEEYSNDENDDNKEENKKIINRIKQIFISKTNCSKFTYHPLISYSIGKYGEYILYLKTIFVEIVNYKNGKFEKKEKTYFNPSSNSFSINYCNLTFIFYIYYNQVQIFSNFQDNFYIYANSDLKQIRKNCIELMSINKKNRNSNDSYNLNTSLFEISSKNINIDGIKNPFDKLIDKKLGFSCKLNNNLFEIKYGFEKIFIDGFYETKDYIKLPFNENKFIEIPIDSVIFLEIEINSSIKNIKKEINKKIQILRLLGFYDDEIYFIGILYNSNNNINNQNNNQDYKINNSNLENEKMYYKDDNFYIYIYNCDKYFLGQKISLIRRIFSDEFTNEKKEILKEENNNKINKIERNVSLDKQNLRNTIFQIKRNENINKMNKIIQETNKKLNEEEEIKKTENINNMPLSLLKSLSNNFSLFEDDILYYQMNIN